MPEKNEQNKESEPLFLSWMQPVTDFWSNFAKMMPISLDDEKKRQTETNNSFLEQWQMNMNLMKSFSQTMSEPDSSATAFKSFNTLPDIILKLAQSGWETIFQMQQHFLEKAGKIGQRIEHNNFENLDQEIFKTFTNIYQKELRPYFHIPQLGLTRFSQERFNELLDKQNIFETTLAEFLSILYQPMEKASKALEEKLESMAEEGVMPEEAKERYDMWVKILEGHYMNLFKTKEYTNAMHNTLNKLEDFVLAKNEAMRDFLQLFPVPTNKEMDELYKEFHILKKRVRELEEKVKSA